MTGRDDLDELHALAASISENTHGWRAHRKVRAQAASERRLEAAMVAPVKRRRSHRWIAAIGVCVVVVCAVLLVTTYHPAKPAPAPSRTAGTVKRETPEARIGHQAGVELASQGRLPNEFACQGWYDDRSLGSVPQQRSASWVAGYLAACSDVN
jgi:ferric-dicitrate binding protein FerR (iron transport regulator)